MSVQITNWRSGGPSAASDVSPIALFLHGYSSDENDLPGLVPYLPQGLTWYSLRAPVDLENGGFAWANRVTPGNPPTADVELATDSVWEWVEANLPETAPLIVIGFSQGGLMATQLLRSRPNRILATVILAGFTLDANQHADSQLAEERPKVLYCRGLQDDVISPEAVNRTLVWLKGHTEPRILSYEGLGHSINEDVLADVSDYLNEKLSVE